MLSLSPITRSVFQNPFSVNGEHEVPVTPELGSPTAALLARRRLSPASPAVVRRQLSASSTTSTNSQQQGPGAEQLPSPLENYRIKLSNYRGHATPSPLLREALAGRKRKSSEATADAPSPGLVHPGAGKREGHSQSSRAKKPSLISPVPHGMSAKGGGSVNHQVALFHEDQVVPVNQTQVLMDEDISRRLPSAPQLGAKPLLLFGGDESDIFATWEE